MAEVRPELRQAVSWSIKQLEAPRRARVKALKEFVGSHYAEGGAERKVPVNMLELAVSIYVGALAARAPRVMVSTSVPHLKPFAKSMELALNQIPEEINLAWTMRRVVAEALFGIGVVKVGLGASGVTVLDHDPGEPFVDVVTLDDYFLDMSAKSRAGIQFEGNDYWLDLDDARALYGQGIEPDEHTVQGPDGENRAEGMGSSEGADLYKDKVWLRDVWLPSERKVVTYGVKTSKLYREVEWDGPEHGPYHTLPFTEVPGNLLPLPPVAVWRDLHELANVLFRKLARQAEAKKDVVAFQGGNDSSIEALKRSRDGEGIRYTGPKPERLTVGGIDAETLAFFLQTKGLFSYHAGNLDALGGLAPMTDTVGQDQLLTQGASARRDRMKGQTIDFARGIWKSLAWYEWTDPVRKRVVEKKVPGGYFSLRVPWSQETREGDFLDFNLDIDPYSMEEDTPQLRLQKVGQVLERFVYPVLPLIQQQGGSLDFRRLFELIADLANLDEVRELVVFGEPIQGDPQQGGAETPSFKPASTTRTYERVVRPGATRHGQDDALSRLLMGGGVQQGEAAAIGRSSA